MLNRREALKRAGLIGVGGVVALRTGRARAQGGRKPALTIALPSNPETIDPHQFRSVLTGSILANICETLLTRDPKTHGAQAAAGHVVAQRRSAHVGVQAAARGEVPQRRALRRRGGEVQHRPHHRLQAQHARQGPVAAVHRPGGADRRSRHGAHHHQGAGPHPAQPRGGGVGEHGAAQGHGRVPREVREPTGRSAPGRIRFVEYVVGERVVRRGESRLLGRQAGEPAHRVADHPRRRHARGRAGARHHRRHAEPAGAADPHGGGRRQARRLRRARLLRALAPAQRAAGAAAQGSPGAAGAGLRDRPGHRSSRVSTRAAASSPTPWSPAR